jgi:hypothetical protein
MDSNDRDNKGFSIMKKRVFKRRSEPLYYHISIIAIYDLNERGNHYRKKGAAHLRAPLNYISPIERAG